MPKDVTSLLRFREASGRSQAALGSEIGVTRQTIAAWERGDRTPSLGQLMKIARALAVPIELLLPEEVGDAGRGAEPTLLFRADAPEALDPALRRALSRTAHDYAAVERLLGEAPLLPESRPMPDYDERTVERLAGEMRDWLGADDAPLGDVLALLEAKGLKLLRYPLPPSVSGFSAYTDDWGGVIVVNDRHPPERQHFTALHELAHLVLHRGEYDGPTRAPRRGDPREKAANHLAEAMLLRRDAIERELRGYRNRWLPEPLLVDIKLRYGVSVRTVLLRARRLGLVSERQCGQQLGHLDATYGRDREPGDLPRSSALGRLERLVFTALVQERITASRAAEILRRPLMEIRLELGRWLVGASA